MIRSGGFFFQRKKFPHLGFMANVPKPASKLLIKFDELCKIVSCVEFFFLILNENVF